MTNANHSWWKYHTSTVFCRQETALIHEFSQDLAVLEAKETSCESSLQEKVAAAMEKDKLVHDLYRESRDFASKFASCASQLKGKVDLLKEKEKSIHSLSILGKNDKACLTLIHGKDELLDEKDKSLTHMKGLLEAWSHNQLHPIMPTCREESQQNPSNSDWKELEALRQNVTAAISWKESQLAVKENQITAMKVNFEAQRQMMLVGGSASGMLVVILLMTCLYAFHLRGKERTKAELHMEQMQTVWGQERAHWEDELNKVRLEATEAKNDYMEDLKKELRSAKEKAAFLRQQQTTVYPGQPFLFPPPQQPSFPTPSSQSRAEISDTFLTE